MMQSPQPPRKNNSQQSLFNPEKSSVTHNDIRQQPNVDTSEQEIQNALSKYKHLKDYPIRDMVKHTDNFGKYLKRQGLETNQIRKFLDAINRIKVKLAVITLTGDEEKDFSNIETDVVMLQPKLAYAAGRKETSKPLKPFSKVISNAIDKVHSLEDFTRLVQLIESIIAYHKAEGGK